MVCVCLEEFLLFRTFGRAIDILVLVDELLAKHRFCTLQTLEAVFTSVPVSVFIGNSLGIRRYQLFTSLTSFGESHVITTHTVGFPVARHIFLPAEHGVASHATEVLQVPVLILCLCVFFRENQL